MQWLFLGQHSVILNFLSKLHIFAKPVLEEITQGMEVADNMKSKLIKMLFKGSKDCVREELSHNCLSEIYI